MLVGEVDATVGNALNDGKEAVVVGKLACLVEVFEVLQHVAHILAVAVEILHKVVVEQVVIVGSLTLEAVESPLGGVIIRKSRNVAQHALVGVFARLQLRQLLFHFVLRRFEQGIKTAQHHHRQYYVAILATQKHIAQNIVGNVPDKRYYLVVVLGIRF